MNNVSYHYVKKYNRFPHKAIKVIKPLDDSTKYFVFFRYGDIEEIMTYNDILRIY